MKRLIPLILVAAIAFFCAFARYDDDLFTLLSARLNSWTSTNPIEKVYLQLDKPYYAAGDDIWLKAYVTKGGEHKLSDISGVLNVELVSPKDSVTRALKLPVIAGMAWGDIKLPDTLAEGNYRIRAYTGYMQNAGEDYYFDKEIAIGNAITNSVIAKANYSYDKQQASATINYTNLDNTPYTGREVSFEIELNNKRIERGKATTDANGNLNINFVNLPNNEFKSGNITTNIKLSDNQKVTKTLPIRMSNAKTDVQFFPEGGTLVNGIRTRIAFKAVNSNGLGADIKGTITDEQNNEVAEINTTHLGMGSFAFTPEAGKSYVAKLNTGTVPLPKATGDGYVLNVYNNKPGVITVKVSVSEATLKATQDGEVSVVAQTGGRITYAAKTKLDAASFSTKIPATRFPTGITQFTLFSKKGEPLNERIVFIQNDEQLKLNINATNTTNPTKTTYSPREKLTLTLNANDKDNKPVTGAFSVAVIDESKVPQTNEDEESTILSHILLTSDIKGYIEKPNYYFTNITEKTKTDLDNLMLTQGYRRFTWKQLLDNPASITSTMPTGIAALTYKPEIALSITGHVRTSAGKPVPKGRVTLFTTAGSSLLLDTIADENGRYVFDNLAFPDSVKFVVQARTKHNGSNVEVTVDNLPARFVKKHSTMAGTEVSMSAITAAYLQNSSKKYKEDLKFDPNSHGTLLKEVVVKDREFHKPKVEYSENPNGPGKADEILLGGQGWLTDCVDLATCLSGRLLGVVFKNHGLPYLTSPMTNIGKDPNPMMVLLDGVQFTVNGEGQNRVDEEEHMREMIKSIDPADIQSIEILRTISYTVLYGAQGADGIFIITTKRGGPAPYERYAPGLIRYHPIGFYQQREFYSPQYDSPKVNQAAADLRSTIYWNPNLITHEDGKTSFSFFNADSKGTYKVIIEGIDNDGNLGRQVFRYKVE